MASGIRYDKGIFAENLQRLMRENRERQVDIARLLEVSKSTLSAYCKGEQMPRMDKIEQLAQHFGVSRAALLGGEAEAAPREAAVPRRQNPAGLIYDRLNDAGQTEYLRYGRYLAGQEEFRREEAADGELVMLKHYLVPAAAGYASPIEGEDYELEPCTPETPAGADFSIDVSGDSMEPYIPDGSRIYVRRDTPLREFEVGVFFVDGDVYCKQWCVDYAGTLHLLSANPARQDANITIARDSGRVCVCFGKVLLPQRLPRPVYL